MDPRQQITTWAGPDHVRRQKEAVTLLNQVSADTATIAQAEARISSNVQTMRTLGVSWGLIADALGISRQGAQKRYGRGGTLI